MGVTAAIAHDTVNLRGVLDGRDAPAVRAAVYAAVADAAREPGSTCLVDLSDATLVDLTILRALAVASRHADRLGVRVVLRGDSAAMRRCTQLSGLGRWLRWERRSA